MNILIPDQDTFRKYRCPAIFTRGSDSCQYDYHFPNGYGASVVITRSLLSEKPERWELAVTKRYNSGEWHLCYNTPITDDFIADLTGEGVCEILEKIICLPIKEDNND